MLQVMQKVTKSGNESGKIPKYFAIYFSQLNT